MKHILTALAFVMISTASFAASHPKGCGPEVEFKIETDNDNSYGSSTTVKDSLEASIGIKWTFGKKATCETSNAAANNLARAKTRSEVAKAQQAEVKLLIAKIKVCTEFEIDTAPESIKDFCGDLLQ